MVSGPIVVAGADSLGLAIAERLVKAGVEVIALASPSEASSYAHEIRRIGADLVVGSPGVEGELVAAGVDAAAALVLTADDESANVDAALAARRLRPDLPIVVRLFDAALGTYLKNTLAAVTVLSMSGTAAPVFADIALRALESPSPHRAAPSRRRAHPLWRRLKPDRVVVDVAAAAIVTVGLATIFFSHALALTLLDALYFVSTTVTTVGYGDISLKDASHGAKVAGIALMFAGAGFVAILYALLSGYVVTRRLDVQRGRIRVRGSGHVIVAGAGNIGFRVTRLLAEKGYRVVVIERNGESRNTANLRAEGHHVIVADATGEDTLDLAGAHSATAVLALTDSDAANLHIALDVRARGRDVPVVARLLSQELARHVAERGDVLVASPVVIASEEFARAALAACARSAE